MTMSGFAFAHPDLHITPRHTHSQNAHLQDVSFCVAAKYLYSQLSANAMTHQGT